MVQLCQSFNFGNEKVLLSTSRNMLHSNGPLGLRVACESHRRKALSDHRIAVSAQRSPPIAANLSLLVRQMAAWLSGRLGAECLRLEI
jgi:hypothetical protein